MQATSSCTLPSSKTRPASPMTWGISPELEPMTGVSQHTAELLYPVGTSHRGQHQGIQLLHLSGDLVSWQTSLEDDALHNTKALRLLHKVLFHGAVADKDQAAVMRQLGQGCYQQIKPFVVFETSNEAKRKGVAGCARLAWLATLVDIGVKPELWDDGDWPGIALAPQDFCRVAIAGKGGSCVTIVVEFQVAKWRWVVAVEVLPGEEKRFCLLFVGESHGMERGEIIGFFVAMPVRRSDEGQFDAGAFGELFEFALGGACDESF